MTAEVDVLVDETVAKLQREIGAARLVPVEQLAAVVGSELRRLLAAVSDGSWEEVRDSREVADLGAAMARLGVPVEDLLRAWTLALEVLATRSLVHGEAASAADVVAFHQAVLQVADWSMRAAAAGHRQADLDATEHHLAAVASFLDAAVDGTAAAGDLRRRAVALGLDPDAPFRVLLARGEDHELRGVEDHFGLRDRGPRRQGLGRVADGMLVGISARAGGGPTAMELPVGMGPAVGLDRLGDSYGPAARALRTAVAFGLAGAFELDDLGLLPAVVDDPDTGERLGGRWLTPLLATRSGQDILASLDAWLAARRNVDQAARDVHVHPNTLRYRLGRAAELTGIDLENPAHLTELWWALSHRRARGRPTAAVLRLRA